MGLDGNSEGGPNRALFLGLTRKSKSPPADDDVGDRTCQSLQESRGSGDRGRGESSLGRGERENWSNSRPQGGFSPEKKYLKFRHIVHRYT